MVLTDWLSMIAPLGVASRPSLSRTMGRSASKTRSQVPSLRHFRKYHQTVPQGGRSWGIIRQEIPPRNTYRMPFTTSRRCTVRGCPLGETVGNRDSSKPHWASVKSVGYALRSIPQSYRLPANHTKLLQCKFRQVATIVTHPLRFSLLLVLWVQVAMQLVGHGLDRLLGQVWRRLNSGRGSFTTQW